MNQSSVLRMEESNFSVEEDTYQRYKADQILILERKKKTITNQLEVYNNKMEYFKRLRALPGFKMQSDIRRLKNLIMFEEGRLKRINQEIETVSRY